MLQGEQTLLTGRVYAFASRLATGMLSGRTLSTTRSSSSSSRLVGFRGRWLTFTVLVGIVACWL
jgi:hypothetical protein